MTWQDPPLWTADDEKWLRTLRREYRKAKARHERLGSMYRFALEKFGQQFLEGLNPETRAWAPMCEEGDPFIRAMKSGLRRVETFKRELLRPGGPDDDALELARQRMLEALKLMDELRPRNDQNDDEPSAPP
jgi:hypothetical protein